MARKENLPEIDSEGNLKRTKFAEKQIEDGKLTIAFGNGEVVAISLDEIPEELHRELAMHGLSQKIGDSYAGAKGNFESAIASASGVIEQLKNGEWKATRAAGESKPRIGELAAAVSRVKKIGEAEALALIDKLDDDAKKAVRNHPAIKLAIQELRTEKAKAAAEKAGELAL